MKIRKTSPIRRQYSVLKYSDVETKSDIDEFFGRDDVVSRTELDHIGFNSSWSYIIDGEYERCYFGPGCILVSTKTDFVCINEDVYNLLFNT